MKKILCKTISLLLIVSLLLPLNIAFSFAADEDNYPVFSVRKIEETPTEIVLVFKLESGEFSCFDGNMTVADYQFSSIASSDEFDAYAKALKEDDLEALLYSNKANGKISIASTSVIVAPLDIAVYKISKTESAYGLNGSDITFELDNCGICAEPGDINIIEITEYTQININVPSTHIHVSDGTRVLIKPADCFEDGEEVSYCTECGQIAETFVIEKLNHANTYTDSKEATCEEDGYTDTYCSDCNTLISHIVIPATNHANTYEERLEPDCVNDGYVKIYCSDCGKLLQTTVLNAKGHSDPVTERKEPTCTEDGYIKTICSECGAELAETVILSATEHNILTEKVSASCTEDGYIRHYCDKCNTEIDYTVIPSEGHKLVTDQKDPTCHEDGYLRIMCSKCGMVKVNTPMPKLEHQWTAWSTVKEPTYRSEGISRRSCKLCGDFQEKTIPMIVINPTSITMSMDSISMNYKQTTRLYANVAPEEASFSTKIIWSSSNERVCKVDENGSVTATGVGTAVIKASTEDGKLTTECTVKVEYTIIQWIIIYILFGWIWYM